MSHLLKSPKSLVFGIGYVCASAHDQNLDLLMDALKKAGHKRIFSNQISGKNENGLIRLIKNKLTNVLCDSCTLTSSVLTSYVSLLIIAARCQHYVIHAQLPPHDKKITD